MNRPAKSGGDADPFSACPPGPPFAPQEIQAFAAWSATMRARGAHSAITYAHPSLGQALDVTHAATDRQWLVHKTPGGAVAVRLWPGLAEIVATVPEALAMIAAALDEAGAGRAAVEMPFARALRR